ncbi:MAG: hypothetical protein RL662_2518 [Bacteroidota bacterium]|jgi:hypothetical protein
MKMNRIFTVVLLACMSLASYSQSKQVKEFAM